MEMNWNEIVAFVLSSVLKLAITFVIPYLAALVVGLIKKKIKSDKVEKYVSFAADVVSKCVAYVDQIYVDALKEDGMFDKEAQKKAFEMCWQRTVLMLNEEAKKAVIEVYGDFEEWLKNAIESSVRENKFSYIEEAMPLIEGTEGE